MVISYRESLKKLGISYVDHETIDVNAALAGRKPLAIARELDHREDLSDLTAGLEAANASLDELHAFAPIGTGAAIIQFISNAVSKLYTQAPALESMIAKFP